MFVTYKESSVTGYTQVYRTGRTIGGGWYETPAGGGFRGGPCGEPCQFDSGDTPQDQRATRVSDYVLSYGFCASSRKEDCKVNGWCALNAATQVGVPQITEPYVTNTSSASLFAKLTCLDGLTSTQSNSVKPYTKTAELACTTSINSGKDVGFLGESSTTKADCVYQSPQNPVSLYAGGYFPFVQDTDKTTTFCGFEDEDGNCVRTETCVGILAERKFYDYCGSGDPTVACLQVYKTVDPCELYQINEPQCEYAYILSKTGSYIGESAGIGPFLTVSATPLSTDKAVVFDITSGKESPNTNDIFSYSNGELTVSALERKNDSFTNSHVFFGENGAETTTFKRVDDGFKAGAHSSTLRFKTEVKATRTVTYNIDTGAGTNPCCVDNCEVGSSPATSTDTLFAGKSYVLTYCCVSTTSVGNYVAFQRTTITKGAHLAWAEFNYSTSDGDVYESNTGRVDEYECVSFSTPITGQGRGFEYFKCVGGNVPRETPVPGPPVTRQCPDLGCGCTGTTGQTNEPGPNTLGQTACYDPCASTVECTQLYRGTGDGDILTFIGPCEVAVPQLGDPVSNAEKNAINRNGDCRVVDKMSLDVAYTHFTSAATETAAFGGMGFAYTLERSEGLYFLDSKGSMQTATSCSLKQSKSDITDSHVTFAFSGAFYNPMGKTTQFGSDGAKKTFIALATGDATYLVGSPDGKSMGKAATTSHAGDVHSYYISDPDAKIWNQASWPGHGVVNGKITTGTFSFSFMSGAFANSTIFDDYYGARFSPGAKQTIVAHGGLVVISSKANASEKSFKTTYSTAAFSTSFDSTFKGAWLATAIPATYVATQSAALNFGAPLEFGHIPVFTCDGCNFPSLPAIPYRLMDDTSTYFIKGDKSLLYNNNATSYLWTDPFFKKIWGDGHGTYCE